MYKVIDQETCKIAVDLVLNHKMSATEASKQFGMSRQAIHRYIKAHKAGRSYGLRNVRNMKNQGLCPHVDPALKEETLNAILHEKLTVKEASLKFNVSQTSIYRWIDKSDDVLNFVKKPKKTPIPSDELCRYIEQNPEYTQKKIANHFGLNQDTISKRLERLNYKRMWVKQDLKSGE